MIPGEIIPAEGEITLNEGRETLSLKIINTGDRPVQVGSHFHFFEANEALDFDREAARGKRLDIPSYRVRAGDVISLRERSQSLTAVAASLEDVRIARPEWIEFDEAKTTATVKGIPKVDSVPFALEIDLVIEYYSKRL